MKTFTLFIVLALFIQTTGSSQPCLPDSTVFTNQADIDNFQINHPNCTEIEGDVTISGNDITNLNGLSVLTSIGGDLYFGGNNSLTSLTGLENVTSIGGDLLIIGGFGLISLTGLDNVTTIGGTLTLTNNYVLTSLTGLENLASIGGDLIIGRTREPGFGNPVLKSLAGLANLTSIGGNLRIDHNDSLSTCEVQGICNYLVSPNGIVDIHSNAPGCNNPPEIAEACGITLLCLPFGKYYFFSQEQIDNFQANYSNCNVLEGDVWIGSEFGSNTTITNLDGLSEVTSIGGDLLISDNDSLVSVSGLGNLTSVGGTLALGRIGYWLTNFFGNPVLTNLTGFENVASIGGDLHILGNDEMASISGIGNVTSIGGSLWIASNNSLGICDIESICNYLENPNGEIEIYGNATGCNSQEEVVEACAALPCLPDGITFTTQEQIDNFQTNYPNCTEIEGHVKIEGDDITNLNGLNVLTSIGGNLYVFYNTNSLTSLTGLDNVMSIGGDLLIQSGAWNANPGLTSMAGLDNLISIGGTFHIEWNNDLTSLTGLGNLTSIGGDLTVENNDVLISLAGLDNVTYIGGSLRIGIVYLPGLDAAGSRNTSLTSLTGLEGLTSILGNLTVCGNAALISMTGLDNVTSIGGELSIYSNALESLTGLESLTTIAGDLTIWGNNALTSLSGLSNVNSIQGALTIGGEFGNGHFLGNDALKSLTGLDNIDEASIIGLHIVGNDSLSACEVHSICDYLASPNGEIDIHDNAACCNNQEEVADACSSSINETSTLYGIKTHPNPFSTSTVIEYELTQPETVSVSFYNQFGNLVDVIKENQQLGLNNVEWTPRNFADGIYYFRLQAGEQVSSGKMMLMR